MVNYYRRKFNEERELAEYYFNIYKDEQSQIAKKDVLKMAMVHEEKANKYMKKIVDLTYKKR